MITRLAKIAVTSEMKNTFRDKIKAALLDTEIRSIFLNLPNYTTAKSLFRYVDGSKDGLYMMRDPEIFNEIVGGAVKDDDDAKAKWSVLNQKYNKTRTQTKKSKPKKEAEENWLTSIK